jgi:high affinity Mn2+ porin
MYNGAWDYPANTRGYTYGVVMELNTMFWALHYGIFAEPSVANGEAIDPRFIEAHGQIVELVENYNLFDCPGKIHEFAFVNRAHMGSYGLALQEMPINPDVTATRAYRYKYGFGLGWEQEVTKDFGLFARLGWDDGHTETWAFTPIDRTGQLGLQWRGRLWHRPQDVIGVAGVINGLAPIHRQYLAAGGMDFSIGDGRLNYAPEQIIEMYYNIALPHGIFVTVDGQGINHPAYNADRGPVAVGSLRVHFEY